MHKAKKLKKKPEKNKPKPASLEAELKRIRSISELALELGLQQLTVGDILVVPSPVRLMADYEASLQPEPDNNVNTDTDEDNDEFFPELSKAAIALRTEQEELRKIEESKDDPDLFNSSIP